MPSAFPAPPPFVPRSEREGRISPWRDIACRSCGRWMNHATGAWVHVHDGTPACVDPTLPDLPEGWSLADTDDYGPIYADENGRLRRLCSDCGRPPGAADEETCKPWCPNG